MLVEQSTEPMNAKQSGLTLVSLILTWAVTSRAQNPLLSESPAADSSFEGLPELKASEILKPEFLKGPHFVVRESVPTSSGMNQFTIDSDFGLLQADGNQMLMKRINEVDAIARLGDVSKTEEFKKSLIAAAKSPLNSAKNIIKDPGEAISNVPKGIMKFMGRAKQTVKNIGQSGGDRSTMKDVVGYTDKKRKIAIQMGIDPYSTNPVLQKELDDVAWASWAGGFTFSAATFPIGGGVGAALTVTNLNSTVAGLLRDKSPEELEEINRAAFRAMGASASDTERILQGGAFTPTEATAFAVNLKSLKGMANRGAFVRAAAEKSSTEADAVFCTQTAALISKLHNGEAPLSKIALIGDFPICIAKDGMVIVALQWDYAAWTPMAEAFVESVQAAQNAPDSSYLVAVSGVVSPRLRQELEARHFRVEDRLAPGPLK
jgi:hypothetical protein